MHHIMLDMRVDRVSKRRVKPEDYTLWRIREVDEERTLQFPSDELMLALWREYFPNCEDVIVIERTAHHLLIAIKKGSIITRKKPRFLFALAKRCRLVA